MHKGHTHTINNEETPPDAVTAVRPIGNGILDLSRTTSTFATDAEDPTSKPASTGTERPRGLPTDSSGGGWGSYRAPSNGFASARQSGVGEEGFGSGGDGQRNQSGGSVGRSIGGAHNPTRNFDDTVTVTLLPEKEGIFMFQHHNYEVKSARRASSVIRRYSDFVWLLDCLHKRYPFRQLPLLPPKRVAGEIPYLKGGFCMLTPSLTIVNGRHLSADVTFIEKRRRGLVRFVNALVKHPVLGQEQLVTMFLTVPTVSEPGLLTGVQTYC
jgi:sorting nexin-8